jgi:hypothetical protein
MLTESGYAYTIRKDQDELYSMVLEDTIQMLTESYDLLAIPPCTLVHFSLEIEKWSDLSSRAKMEQHKAVLREIIRPKSR